jgi:oxygen-independent coproporphyrinogen III oxidase
MSLGLYIQVPFCQTKCTYCNFHTGVVSRDRYQPYANAVCREIGGGAVAAALNPAVSSSGHGFLPRGTKGSRAESSIAPEGVSAPEARQLSADTVYFGGGTPSLLDPGALAKILDALRATYSFETPEITLEADPETISTEKANSWLAAGFNRISLGVQSLNDRELQATGRMHRRADIARATETLRAAGFDNISMDLIIGLPHQTRESWEQSVSELLDLRPEHISIYMLEVDEGSHLGKESLAGGTRYSAATIPSDDAQAEFYDSACTRLATAGYDHYEISNWAFPGRRSRHNLKYWQREPYLGLGAGAHSFDGKTRWANVHDSAQYVTMIEQGISPREQIEPVTPEQALEEEFFLGLRRLEGIDLAQIERNYAANRNGTSARLAKIHAQIGSLCAQRLLIFEAGCLRVAPDRLTISNSILAELLA